MSSMGTTFIMHADQNMHASPTSVTVIMPTYNGAAYLSAALASLEAQGPALAEVIVIDDGSSDSTLDIVRSYVGKLPIRCVERSHRGNWVANTNFAIAETTTEFVTFLHQDDLWLPGRLETFCRTVERHPTLNVFLNRSRFISDDGRDVGPWSCPLPSGRLLAPSDVFPRLFVQNFIAIPGPIIRRSLLSATPTQPPLDEALWYLADWKLWLTLAKEGNWFYWDRPLTGFRIHPHSITASSPVSADYRGQFEHIQELFGPTLERLVPRQAARWRAVAAFSVAMNLALANAYFRSSNPWLRLGWSGARLGPRGLYDYVRYSRIVERVSSRLRVLSRSRKQNRALATHQP